jgi:hypothetical protein
MSPCRAAFQLVAALFSGWLLLLSSFNAAAGEASGTVSQTFKSGKVTVKPQYAFLVSGPDFEGRSIRQLILAETDIAPSIRACDSFSCATWDLNAGASVNFDGGPRLGYWVVSDGQRKQHSGVAKTGTMALTADNPKRLAGTWTLTDDGQGTTASVKFDSVLIKSFKK